MAVIEFDEVTKSFRVGRTRSVKDALLNSLRRETQSHVVKVVDNVSFSILEGQAVALLGHNGSGKSTALKLIAGTIAPSSGTVITRGRVAPLLELGAGFHPDLTGRENIFLNAAILGVRRGFVHEHLDEIIDFAELKEFIDEPVRHYSSGMYARLGFAVAVNVEPRIVLVDEVLAVGDAEFQRKCLARMADLRDEGRTLILVTHSLTQAEEFCDRALVFDHGRLTFDGPMSDAAGPYARSTRSRPVDD